MTVSLHRFHLLARLFGGLLLLMGGSLLAVFATFLVTGVSPLEPDLTLSGPGMLVLATIGAFALPLGLSLFGGDTRTSARLRIAGGALGLMALLRLIAFLDPGLRAALGVTPLVEFFVLGALATFAMLVRPQHEAPVELLHTFAIPASADAVWEVLGEQFGDVAQFASGVRSSSMDGPLCVGATRSCESEPFGPFPSSHITEQLVEFSREARRFTYVAGGDLPAFIPASTNRWSVQPVDAGNSRVSCHASLDLAWWALPAAPLVGWLVRPAILSFGRDLLARMEADS